MAYVIEPTYERLREQAFAWRVAGVRDGSPYGFILETGYPPAIFTLAVMRDSPAIGVSLYFSKGGGIIGGGRQKGPREAAATLAQMTARFNYALPQVHENPLPNLGETRLYILIDGIWRGASGPEVDFGHDRMAASPLFHAAHRVIAELMKLHESGAAP